MSATDLTVAALVERDGRFLMIEESVGGERVLTQPGGHIDAGETPEAAACREVLEEAACEVRVRGLIGAYMWCDDARDRDYLRIVFLAELLAAVGQPSEPGIHAVRWMSYAEIYREVSRLRSPSVMRAIDDYLAGARQPLSLFAGCTPREELVDTALASAALLSA